MYLKTEEKAKAYDRAKEKIVLRFGSNVAEEIFSEFDESEDEKIISAIRKAIEAKVENLGNGVTRTACLAWLEKQRKPIDEEKVLIGVRKDAALSIMKFLDRCTLGMCLSGMERADLEDAVVNSDWSKAYDYMKKKLEKQCEPKFKVGDYVVDNCGYVWRIEGIINQFYILEGIDGGESRPTIEWVNKTFHLWDITEDAKNGDVLASKDEKDILIFRRIEPSTSFSSYYNIKGRGNYGWCDSYFIPATKEQRDKLEKSMADAGYAFDFDEKKLKKIEQKPADEVEPKFHKGDWVIYKQGKELKEIEDEEYNDEDYGIDGLWHAKNILEKSLGKVDGYQTDDGILDHKCAISSVSKLYKEDAKIKNRWKPSEEQIYWLKWAIGRMTNTEKGNEAEAVLKDLLEQLEKLLSTTPKLKT